MKEQIIVGAVGVLDSFEFYFSEVHGKPNLLFSPAQAREFGRRLIEGADVAEQAIRSHTSTKEGQ